MNDSDVKSILEILLKNIPSKDFIKKSIEQKKLS
jgi:hypothetical protein